MKSATHLNVVPVKMFTSVYLKITPDIVSSQELCLSWTMVDSCIEALRCGVGAGWCGPRPIRPLWCMPTGRPPSWILRRGHGLRLSLSQGDSFVCEHEPNPCGCILCAKKVYRRLPVVPSQTEI